MRLSREVQLQHGLAMHEKQSLLHDKHSEVRRTWCNAEDGKHMLLLAQCAL